MAATETATATGSYVALDPAVGTVIFYNFSGSPVLVEAETLVAAGKQAFRTTEAIVVEPGFLTPFGQIQAGEEPAEVTASQPGPAANVQAGSIDTVLSDPPRSQLQVFSNNENRLVDNPEGTSGGAERTGPEFTQDDVDDAVAALRSTLDAEVERQLEAGDAVIVPVGGAARPVLDSLGGLVGMRDEETAEISGTLTYDSWLVQRDDLARAAAERLGEDRQAVPAGYELLTDATAVEVTEATADERGATLTVTVTGRATASVDEQAVLQRIRGLGADEAEDRLATLGDARIELWPAWVTSVPDFAWRIDVAIAEGEEVIPNPSGSP